MQLPLAHHRDQHVERLFGNPVELFDVEQRAVAEGGDERPVDEHVGVVTLGEHASRVEVADQPGGGQLGVALDELEADPELAGDRPEQRRLAGARRAFDQYVAAGVEGGEDQLELAPAPDEPAGKAVERLSRARPHRGECTQATRCAECRNVDRRQLPRDRVTGRTIG